MSKHKCDRESCDPRNVNGPKIKCAKCKNLCYLKCFNIGPAEGKNDSDIVKFPFVNGCAVYMPLSQLAFVCCGDSISSAELKSAMKPPTKRSTSNTRQTKQNEKNDLMFTSELDTIKIMLEEIVNSSSAHTNELRELKSIANETNVAVKKVTESSNELSELKLIANETNATLKKATEPSNENASAFATPKPSKHMNFNFSAHKPSFAEALRSDAPWQSNKRRRTETNNATKPVPKQKVNKKFDAPKPKVGTKTTFTGLSVVENKKFARVEKPTFTRAVWISRLNPETTNEDIVNYIIVNTQITDTARFNVHKLIKKGCDLSTLKFVSFKIEVNDDDFVILNDPVYWPVNVMVREFRQDLTLANFFPKLPSPKNRISTENQMETSTTQPSKSHQSPAQSEALNLSSDVMVIN